MRISRLTQFFIILIVIPGYSQLIVRQTSQWKTYQGKLNEGKSKINIEISLLFLNEGYVVGSFSEIKNRRNHKIVGQIKNDTLFLTVREHASDTVEGSLVGVLQKQDNTFIGLYKTEKEIVIGNFKLKRSLFSSYTDYLMKYRALKEYTTIYEVLINPKEVVAIDFSDQELSSLPDEFIKLKKVVSVNLMGNKFKEFPTVLTKLKTIEEISLSTNGIESITNNIGKLRNLRVLILNRNHLSELPKEIGKLNNLLYLELGNNRLVTIPEEIKYLTKLQELHIEGNLLNDFEKERLKKLLPYCSVHL
jgi:Leucine-rich repeat (LRR) protein